MAFVDSWLGSYAATNAAAAGLHALGQVPIGPTSTCKLPEYKIAFPLYVFRHVTASGKARFRVNNQQYVAREFPASIFH
jgi:hypothetical protein